jgi:DUF2924 family protein
MSQDPESRIAQLPKLDRTALCDLWESHFRTSPPSQLRRDLMIPILAYRIQEQAFGSLKAAARNRLRQLAGGFAQGSGDLVKPNPSPKPGTRLIREWGDQVHLVNVGARGFEYKGGRYKSLSQIARLITGTRWSGPVFFGIKNDRSGIPSSREPNKKDAQ